MTLEGKLLIGQQAVTGSSAPIQATDPSSNERLEPVYAGGTAHDVDRACELAWAAFDTYRETSLEERATFLETIAA
ncbi:aldehyde dehydrogenase family protein, partial [Halomonas sp. HP20-15]|uniref:aldehyde dehydrogenase family protein n=1 Tax=Halomonas sp. HP20-15 TaxID=3085901 RepID=UPI002981EA2E